MNKIGIAVVLIIFLLGITLIVVRNQKRAPSGNNAMQVTPTPTTEESAVQTSVTPRSSSRSTPTPTSGLIRTIAQITLTISSPQPGAVVTNSQLTVKGKTTPKAEVYVNEAEGFADVSGNFSATITLDEGENPVVVTAVDENGNMAEKDFVVTYNAGE